MRVTNIADDAQSIVQLVRSEHSPYNGQTSGSESTNLNGLFYMSSGLAELGLIRFSSVPGLRRHLVISIAHLGFHDTTRGVNPESPL